jgi:hypothetical protein
VDDGHEVEDLALGVRPQVRRAGGDLELLGGGDGAVLGDRVLQVDRPDRGERE